jgi:hypothetical protein
VRNRVIGLFAIGCVVVSTALVAGCGGGSSSTTGASGASGATGASGAVLSQQEFVSQADAICKDSNDKTAALTKPTSMAELATVAGQEITIANDTLAQLQALTPPSDVQAKYSQYLSDGAAQISVAGDLQAAAQAGDTAKVTQIGQRLKANSPDPEAAALGLSECAKDVSPQG